MGAAVHVAGVDLGGTKILGRVLDPDDPCRVLVEARRDTPRGGAAVTDAVVAVVDELRSGLSASHDSDLGAVGVGAAGLVDDDGMLRFAPNLPGVVEFPLRPTLAARLGVPVVVENDATAAAWAELRLGAGRGTSELVLVTLGTGIGAGLVLGGTLQRGASGFAGEPGHMIVDPAGPPCPCGRHGCWERYASGSGLGRLARDAAQAGLADHLVALSGGDADLVRGEHVAQAARAGDPDAVRILDDFAWWVALGLANLVNVLDCEVIVVGGGLSEMGELLLAPVRRHHRRMVLAPDHRPAVRIVAADLGARAGALGAWLLATEVADPAWE